MTCKTPRPSTRRDDKNALDAFARLAADPSPRFVFLVLTRYAGGENPAIVWPPLSKIATHTGYSEQGVRNALAWLIGHGFLWRIKPPTFGKRPGALVVPRPTEGTVIDAGRPAFAVIHGLSDGELAEWLAGPTLATMGGSVEPCDSLARVLDGAQSLAAATAEQDRAAARADIINVMVRLRGLFGMGRDDIVRAVKRDLDGLAARTPDPDAFRAAAKTLDLDAMADEVVSLHPNPDPASFLTVPPVPTFRRAGGR